MSTEDQARELSTQLRPIIEGMFAQVIDNPDGMALSADLHRYKDVSGVKYSSPVGLLYTVTMDAGDLPRAARTLRAATEWLVSVQGKNRIPIKVTIAETRR